MTLNLTHSSKLAISVFAGIIIGCVIGELSFELYSYFTK